MAEERYNKHNILAIPDIEPKRSYESEGVIKHNEVHWPVEQPDRELEIIDDLDKLSEMAELLPPEISDIIRSINKVLSEDSQGKLILELIHKKEQPDGGWPAIANKDDNGDDGGTWVVNVDHDDSDGDIEIEDIFSAEPAFTIDVSPSDSLVELARKAYKDDDLDIKEHYVTGMTQITARFYQIMSTLAIEGGMPDYSYLLRDFDGTAVSTDDENQKHLIDSICKNQILYNQRLRQMNLTHTAQNTLIMTRGFSAAEAQRERYLGEKFKQNMNDTASTLSNDILEKERQKSDNKYKEAAYNMYKYLDSATKYTNAMLNLKIDEGAAKVQLSNTGSDIFAQTPPPPPTADNIDDGFDTIQEQTAAGTQYVQNMQKDSVTGAEANIGANGSRSGGSFTMMNGKGNDVGDSDGVGPGKLRTAKLISGMTGIKTEYILAQMIVESGWTDDESGGAYHNYGGLKAGDIGYGLWGGSHTVFPDDETYAKTWVGEVIAIQRYQKELIYCANNNDPTGYVHYMKLAGYFTSSESVYAANFASIVRSLS